MNNPDPAPTLWCVELVPKLKDSPEADCQKFQWLAKGLPTDPTEALFWTVKVMQGITDHRDRRFLRIRQRLVVFRDKRQASAQAKKQQNDSWSACVRPVNIV